MTRIIRSPVRPIIGSPAYSPTDLPVYRGGASGGGGGGSFDPSSLFTGGETGDYWDFTTTTGLYQDAAKTTPVTTAGDVIGAAVGERGVLDITQATTADKPLWTLSASGRYGALLSQTKRRFLAGTFASGFSGDFTIVIGLINVGSWDGGGIAATQYAGNPDRAYCSVNSVTTYANAGVLIGGSSYLATNATGTNTGTEYELVCSHDSSVPELQLDNKIGAMAQETFTVPTTAGAAVGQNFAIGINTAAGALRANAICYRVLTINRKLNATEIANTIAWARASA